MMYYCRDCGTITPGEDDHGDMRCFDCGSYALEEAVQCPICGDWHKDELRKWCSRCQRLTVLSYKAMHTNILTLMDNDYAGKPDSEAVLELMADCFEDFYDETL